MEKHSIEINSKIYSEDNLLNYLSSIQKILDTSYKYFLVDRRDAELAAKRKGFELKEMLSYEEKELFAKWFQENYPDFGQIKELVGDKLFKEFITIPTRLSTIVYSYDEKTSGEP